MRDKVALGFVDAINAHDVDRISTFMSDDHIFIDAYGNRESKDSVKDGWKKYFKWFPDYSIEITDVFESGNAVAMFGYASGTYRSKAIADADDGANHWRLPAAWKAVIDRERIKEWQVCADSKIPYDIKDAAKKEKLHEI